LSRLLSIVLEEDAGISSATSKENTRQTVENELKKRK
jgi:hypothetical protein